MKHLLLILPLLFWLGCEDEKDDAVYISNEFLRCGEIKIVKENFQTNDTYEFNIEWDGFLQKYPYIYNVNGIVTHSDTVFQEHDQYGNIILSDYSDVEGSSLDSLKKTYTDYFKLVQYIIYQNDGQNDTINYTWNGLTATNVENPEVYYTVNQYGLTIEDHFYIYEYLDDDKRLSSITTKNDVNRYARYEWDGYSFEVYDEPDQSYHSGKIDEYGNITEIVSYDDCENDDCEPRSKVTYEYDCTIFEPVPQ